MKAHTYNITYFMSVSLFIALTVLLGGPPIAHAAPGNCPLNLEWNGTRCVMKGTAAQLSNNPDVQKGIQQIKEQTGIDVNKIDPGVVREVQKRLEGIENEINIEDGVDAKEIQYIVGRIIPILKGVLKENVIGTLENIKDGIPFVGGDKEPKWGTDIDGDGITDFDPNEENPFDETDAFTGVSFNTFDTQNWPDENGTKIAKMVDPYGKERFTSDGKHFYNNAYDAAHSGSGLSNISNTVGDAWSDFKGIFSFKGKLPDKDKELQREIAREVLKDAKSQKEKDVEKAYDKLSDKFKVPKFGDVPAKTVIEIAKEARETDFAGGVLVYITERKKGSSMATIKENFSEELSDGYGTFGKGVSLSTTNKYAQAVIYARYEETYQRYLLAKEFGRKE